jgi:hypothetical protein
MLLARAHPDRAAASIITPTDREMVTHTPANIYLPTARHPCRDWVVFLLPIK